MTAGTECHHIIVEDWDKMEEPGGCLFVSMPSLLDPSLCPEGTQIVHIFTPDWIHNWEVRFCGGSLSHAVILTRSSTGPP